MANVTEMQLGKEHLLILTRYLPKPVTLSPSPPQRERVPPLSLMGSRAQADLETRSKPLGDAQVARLKV